VPGARAPWPPDLSYLPANDLKARHRMDGRPANGHGHSERETARRSWLSPHPSSGNCRPGSLCRMLG